MELTYFLSNSHERKKKGISTLLLRNHVLIDVISSHWEMSQKLLIKSSL